MSEPTTTQEAERPHSKHSPSSLEPKRICPGWFNDPDPNRDKSAADRGTLGHLMVETEDFTLAPDDEALTKAALNCYKFIKRFTREGTKHLKETKLPVQDQFGYLDHIYIQTDGSADLVDEKFAHNVYRADSAQFWGYVLGVWDEFSEVNEVRVWVLHPFIDKIVTETYTRDADYDWIHAAVRSIIDGAENPDPSKFRINKNCNYCGRIGSCSKWAEFGVEIASRYSEDHEKFVLPSGSVHGSDIDDPATLAVLWRIAPIVTKAAEGWRKAALEKRLEGVDIPGTELFEKKGSRDVTNATAAFTAVADRVKPQDFIEACDVKIGALEKVFAATFPRGKKGPSKKELMNRLIDADAVSSGAPQTILRELK